MSCAGVWLVLVLPPVPVPVLSTSACSDGALTRWLEIQCARAKRGNGQLIYQLPHR